MSVMMAAAVGTAIAGGLTAVSQIRTANAEANQMRAQARTENINLALRNRESDERRRALIGEQRAAAGAAGVLADTGSVGDVQAETAGKFQRDKSIDRMATRNRTDIIRSSAQERVRGGYISAAATLIGTGGKIASGMASPSGTPGQTPSPSGGGSYKQGDMGDIT